MTSKLGYVLAGLALVAVAGAFFLGWYSGTNSGQPGAPGAVAGRTAGPAQGAPAAPAQPKWVVTANYGSWQVRCQQPAPATGSVCTTVLQISEKATGRILFAWIVAKAKDGMITVLETPTGVQIQSGLDIKIGDLPVHHVAFTNCLPQRCTGQVAMDEALTKQMSTGDKATVTIVAADGRGIEFAMSLTGFDKALAVISK